MGEISLSSPDDAPEGAGMSLRGLRLARTLGGPDPKWGRESQGLKQLSLGGSWLGGLGDLAAGLTRPRGPGQIRNSPFGVWHTNVASPGSLRSYPGNSERLPDSPPRPPAKLAGTPARSAWPAPPGGRPRLVAVR